MSEPIVLHIRPTPEAARYLLDHIGDLGSDAGRVVALVQIVEDLLLHIAELEAYPAMSIDPGAEQRGYDKAVANLRDSDRFVTWAFQRRPPTALMADVCAEYLEAVKETRDAV